MADTKTKTTSEVAVMPPETNGVGELTTPAGLKLRIPYSKSFGEYSGIDQRQWQVLIDSIWPGAQTFEGVCMALSYCIARRLDPMKRPVHIVPMWSSSLKKMIETVWPGISEIRTTATRTGVYAGKDAAEFGPDVEQTFVHEHEGKRTEKTVIYPEWCRVTVYRMVEGVRCAFVGPKVLWIEAYATENRFSMVPNEMWADRRSGQIEKCAEAGSLRAAFPEELGNEYTAEEMWGRTINTAAPPPAIVDEKVAVPPRPTRDNAFEGGGDRAKPKKGKKKSEPDQGSSQSPEEGRASEGAEASVGEVRTHQPSERGKPTPTDASPPGGKETVLQRGVRILLKCKATKDVADLRKTIEEEIDDPEIFQAWTKACDERSKEILHGQS